MKFFLRASRFIRSLPRVRFFKPFAIRLDQGHDNDVEAKGRLIATIRLYGSQNRIELPKTSSFTGHITIRGHGNRILIGENCRLTGELIVKGRNQTVTIGEGTTFESVYVLSTERCDVTIGRWCMFSRGIEVRTSDSHSLIRKRDGRRLNRAAPVVVGDHVWVGLGSILNKGTVIPEDCIVGAKSFVNKAFSESGVVLAGTPATVVKRGVTWSRARKRRFSQDEMEAWRIAEPVIDDEK
ncbi:hypothetical protein ADU59_02540 [Pararhizobium polonicum]|uniref:Acyltransferase n=1 Tax=Pararhizobium polonicum TaxID=1612624 RepID=A0A1C7P5W6_9HYPH|nr:hypothetical protein [Pararhizobium polonicum]OBZ96649.1 hypothetical protein ADU59_02540 [Pararhizobium polonicum]